MALSICNVQHLLCRAREFSGCSDGLGQIMHLDKGDKIVSLAGEGQADMNKDILAS